jgi:hypothetical protein
MISDSYAMYYSKFVQNKKKVYEQSDVYFGCLSDDIEELKNRGREISSLENDIVICKIFKIHDSLDSMSIDALEYFENFCNALNDKN